MGVGIVKLTKNNALLFFTPFGDDGYLSNWYLCDFKVDNIKFHSGEQWFMYAKALLFGDEEIGQMILDTPLYRSGDNKKIKALGRQVSNFDSDIWDKYKMDLIFKGLLEKFSQNQDLKNKLLSTGDKLLVEDSPYDKIWGIGLSSDVAKAWDTDSWLGENCLGKVLMDVRKTLQER